VAQVKFGIWAMSVHHPKSKQLLTIDDIGGGRSLYEVARDALRARMASPTVREKSDGSGNATQFKRVDCDDDGRVLHGVGQYGGYGQGSTLLNVRTATTTLRDKVEADLRPYYFYLDASGDSKQAILLVQVAGIRSLRLAITESLQEALRGIDETLQLKSEGCIPGDVLKALARDGTVKTIQVEKRGVSQDRVDAGVNAKQTGTLKMSYTVRKGIGRAWKNRLGLADGTGVATFVPADGLTAFNDYDSLKVQVKVGTSTKTVDLGRLGDPQPSLLPDQSKIGLESDGNPRIADIHVLAKAEVDELRQVLNQMS